MARVYHRDQAGAPALVYNTSATDVAHFTAFKTVLKACLVDGYGSIPAAGWELVLESSSGIVLRNGSHRGYVHFTYSAGVLTIYLSASYLGIGSGDGIKTGVAANNATPHKFSLYGLVGYSASSTWAMVADERTFILLPFSKQSSAPAEVIGSEPASYSPGTMYVGEDATGNFVACGGLNSTTTSVTGVSHRFGASGFTSLYYPSSGLLVDTGSITVRSNVLSTVTEVDSSYVTPLPEVVLSKLGCLYNDPNSGWAWGDLRGICADVRLLDRYVSSGARALGGPVITTRNTNTPLDLGDGYAYLVCPKYSNQAPFFLATNNPEFW